MISYLLEKKRKAQKRTLLGIELDINSIAMIKLNKTENGYSLDACEVVENQSGWETGSGQKKKNLLSYEQSINALTQGLLDFIKKYKLSKSVKLGFVGYTDIDFYIDNVRCDKRGLKIIEEEGASHYIRNFFLKKKYPDDFSNLPFTYLNNLEKSSSLEVYYMPDRRYLFQLEEISKKVKKELAFLGTDKQAVYQFVNTVFAKGKGSILLGLYSDKLIINHFDEDGNYAGYENMSLFGDSLSMSHYVDEALAFLDRFIEMLLLENMDDENFTPPNVYMYGLKKDFVHISQNIINLSDKECSIVDSFEQIDKTEFGDEVPYKQAYVVPVGIALTEEFHHESA